MGPHLRRQALLAVKRREDADAEELELRERYEMELLPPSKDQPDVEFVHQQRHLTRWHREACEQGELPRCGVLQFMCGGGTFGSQLKGPRWQHLWGNDNAQKKYERTTKRRKKKLVHIYEESFLLNNDDAAYVHGDMLKMTRAKFRSKLDEHEERTNLKSGLLLIIITLCCSRASPASETEREEAEEWYEDAIRKSKEFILEAEKDHKVFVVQEFLNKDWVLDIIKRELPDARIVTIGGHIHEDRKRAYVFQRAEGVPELFMEEMRNRIDAYGRKSVAEALEDIGVAVPPFTRVAQGCWTKKERRDEKKGRDPRRERVTTICKNNLVMQYYKSAKATRPFREERLEPEAVLHLRSPGGDYKYVFPKFELITRKRAILGMGVSLIIGSAVRAAFERYFEPDLELREGGSVSGRS